MYKYLFFFSFLSALLSCKTYDKVVYFQGEMNQEKNEVAQNAIKIQPGDFLSIVVLAEDIETARDFNFPSDLITVGGQVGGYTQGNPTTIGYAVDSDGNVSLPVIGKVNLQGLTLNEAGKHLLGYYEQHLLNPVVNIQIKNFLITVLGDVTRPGTYQVPNERMTILQALGVAGDLNITANRKNILVVREIEGVKTTYRVDITRSDLLFSPVFYLRQNDVIYVEPNATKRVQSTLLSSNVAGLILSTISISLSILAFTRF
jgi:polysaccharide export outer membrane protein